MEMPSRRDAAYDRPSATAKLQALLSDLRRKVQLLSSDIVAEEQLTRIFDLSDPRYSILARNQRTRRDNLLATIAVIENN
jgi:hypothetical protein